MSMPTIMLQGKEWPLNFGLNAMEDIQTRYGAVTDLFGAMSELKEQKWVLWRAIKDGVDLPLTVTKRRFS